MANDTSDLVAAFLARGGTVTRCATGADSGFSSRDWHKAVRGETSRLVAPDVAAERAAEAQWHEAHDVAAEARLNGRRVTGLDNRGNVYVASGNRSVRY